jgi:hypothetical protein
MATNVKQVSTGKMIEEEEEGILTQHEQTPSVDLHLQDGVPEFPISPPPLPSFSSFSYRASNLAHPHPAYAAPHLSRSGSINRSSSKLSFEIIH